MGGGGKSLGVRILLSILFVHVILHAAKSSLLGLCTTRFRTVATSLCYVIPTIGKASAFTATIAMHREKKRTPQ